MDVVTLVFSVIFYEVVELLVVYTFVKSTPNGPPSSQMTNFPQYALPPPIFSILQKQRCL